MSWGQRRASCLPGNSVGHTNLDTVLQGQDGTYKLVGVVNWGGGQCGEASVANVTKLES